MANPVDDEQQIELRVLPDIFRPIGPGDDVVVSAEKLWAWRSQGVGEAAYQQLREDWQLKTAISGVVLAHVAEKLDMTVDEYGQVYDSEKHEQMLNQIMRLIISRSKQL